MYDGISMVSFMLVNLILEQKKYLITNFTIQEHTE